jgi:hypothetical protein
MCSKSWSKEQRFLMPTRIPKIAARGEAEPSLTPEGVKIRLA